MVSVIKMIFVSTRRAVGSWALSPLHSTHPRAVSQGCSPFSWDHSVLCAQVLPSSSFPARCSRVFARLSVLWGRASPHLPLPPANWGSSQGELWGNGGGQAYGTKHGLPFPLEETRAQTAPATAFGFCAMQIFLSPPEPSMWQALGILQECHFVGFHPLLCCDPGRCNKKLYQLYSCQLRGSKDFRDLLGNSLAPAAAEPTD